MFHTYKQWSYLALVIYGQRALETGARRAPWLLLLTDHWKLIACLHLLIQCGTIKGEAAREESSEISLRKWQAPHLLVPQPIRAWAGSQAIESWIVVLQSKTALHFTEMTEKLLLVLFWNFSYSASFCSSHACAKVRFDTVGSRVQFYQRMNPNEDCLRR